MSRSQPVDHPGWEGWYFEDGYLCTPNGDRFSALVVHACFFWKQMTEVRSLWQTGSMREDAPLVRTDTGPGRKIRWEIEKPGAKQSGGRGEPVSLPAAAAAQGVKAGH